YLQSERPAHELRRRDLLGVRRAGDGGSQPAGTAGTELNHRFLCRDPRQPACRGLFARKSTKFTQTEVSLLTLSNSRGMFNPTKGGGPARNHGCGAAFQSARERRKAE